MWSSHFHSLSKHFKGVPLFIGCMSLCSLVYWAGGDKQLAIFYLSLIPLYFVGWGLSIVLAGRKRRKISKNLTDAERKSLDEMAKSYLWKSLYLFGIPSLIIVVTADLFFDESIAVYSFVICNLLSFPFIYRMGQPIRKFYFETEYAKKTFGKPS